MTSEDFEALRESVELERRGRVPALADKLLALREAWLDLPFDGIVPGGWGESIQRLVNAATELVDPDRTLRDTEEAKRRGGIATMRTRAEWYADQVVAAVGAGMSPEWVTSFTDKRDEAIAECRATYGVELLVATERKPWTP